MLRIKAAFRRICGEMKSLNDVSRATLLGIAALVVLGLVFSGVSLLLAPKVSVASALDEEQDEGSVDVPIDSLIVYVSGCVAAPGVYEIPIGSRVTVCVEAAGGFTDDANLDGINLARTVSDGEHIIVPAIGEAAVAESGVGASGLISINTATLEELCKLDGVGEVLAGRIIAYRDRFGGFTTLAQLKEVSGIGSKRFAAICDDVCL